MSTCQSLSEFVDFKEKTGEEFKYENYYFKCGDRILNQQEYEMSNTEKNYLKGLYLLYEIKLDGIFGNTFRDSRSIEFQKDFYTKLFIYDKIHQIEKENEVDEDISSHIYGEYVVELNTTANIDGKQTPKRAMDVFLDFAKEELKEDKEFLRVINTFCNSQIDITFSSTEEGKDVIDSKPSDEEEKSTSNKKMSKLKVFCKKFIKNTVR